ncbi:PIG-X-domain-containing protein [Pyrenophora tritici-repentis]|nr:PIG-X-domain-containing protein [Pyrenophora tritici-repentis]KAF7454291.1 PIG-X-domain-containing protein [Pyrenophora tritici-repentis]KAI0584855.1 PIG-X-domain-containing protein [Pyrenophora tritici-repentis]KAI1538143.1 PIG-X-domain-containing protein [Pyrenophora tritici-repentis]PZD02582.1 PIG-X domain containing protein [Pyrenophora tritici-repentis]
MKQRITYVVHKPEEFTPEQIEITQDELGPRFALKNVQAAKEHRITLGLDELPSNIGNIFQQWHELHVRWASPKPHAGIPPFTSRVSPGLHVFFTPLSNTPEDALCSQLHWLIPPEVSRDDLKCSTTSSTSTKLPILSERFSMSATSQFYAYLDNIGAYKGPWQSIMCEKGPLQAYCEKLVNAFSTARSVDIDYDTISRSVVLTALWPVAEKESWEKEKGWTSTHRLPSAWMIKHGGLSPNEVPTEDSTVEIGVLSHEGNADPEDIQFGGFLTVLGQDQKPSLHPTLTLTLPTTHLTPPAPSCKLHAHLTLPSYLFIDKYQFTDALFLASKNIKSLRSLSGATDLEAPDWVVEEWGSAALFQLAGTWNISIPLHLRYLPASHTGYRTVPVPWPVVFWACHADSGAQHASNPFDRTHLGYEGLFGPKTRFLHVDPKPDVDAKGQELIREKLLVGDDWLVEFIKVPVLATGRSTWVEGGTVGIVLVAFVGLCWVLFGRRGGSGRNVEGGEKKVQ